MNSAKVRVISCKAKPGYILWVKFDDGLEGEINVSNLVGQGVFKAWELVKFFESVKVDPESHTVCWGSQIDLDPYVIRDEIQETAKEKRDVL